MSTYQETRTAFFALRDEFFSHAKSGEPVERPRRKLMRLRDLHHDDWDMEFEETQILFYCLRRAKPARAHGLLSRLKVDCEKRGEQARFASFFEIIKDVLHPEFITPHGYCTTFSQRPAAEIFAALDENLAPLFSADTPVILYAGALLGYVRDGALIGHDDDIDVAIHLGDHPLEDIAPLWHAYKKRLKALGLLDEKSVDDPGVAIKLVNKLGIDVDLFPSWTSNDRFSVYPYSLDALARDAIFPLKPFLQTRIMLPNDPEAMLVQSYGQGWKVPDPLFHFDWPDAKRRFGPLCAFDFTV